MTRRHAKRIAVGLAALLIVAVVAFLIIVRTAWFSNFVRQEIISSTEASTGGKVDIGSFRFEISGLRAIITNFVIHGYEPAGAPPLVRADKVEIHFHLFTNLRHLLDVTWLGIDRPSANIMILADGRTNIPSPKTKSDTSALQTAVDLAVGHFELRDGLITMESLRQPFDLRGNNLRALLDYNALTQSYKGQLSLDPLYILAGRNTPVNFKIALPVTLRRDRIDIQNATVTSPLSNISISGSIENMRNPKVTAHLNGAIAVADLKNAANLPLDLKARNLPSQLILDANATISASLIQVTGLRAGFGRSNIEASGTLKDPRGAGSLALKARVSLTDLGRLLNIGAKPDGELTVNANGRLDGNYSYQVDGNVAGAGISFQEGKQRIRNVTLQSALSFNPHDLQLKGLRLHALGAEFTGDASLVNFTTYKLEGNLRHLDSRTALSAIGEQLPYDGLISGAIAAQGDAKTPGVKSITARGRLTIDPASHGIPVSGRVNAEYNGAADDLSVQNSFLTLPHSRITLNGSVGRKLDVTLTTRDPADLIAAANPKTFPKITFERGDATFTGAITGRLAAPRITGHLAANRFSAEGRRFDGVSADLAASNSGVAVSNGLLTRDTMQAQFSGSVGLRNWDPLPQEPVSADITLRNADLADIATLAGQPANQYSGALTAAAHIDGTIGNPQGSASLQTSMGTILGYPFDQAQLQANLTDQRVTIPSAFIQSGPGRIDLTGEFQHPPDSISTGRVHVHLQSNQMNLAQIRAVQAHQPDTSGQLQLTADVTGNLRPNEFVPGNVNADIAASGLRFQRQTYGDLTASARTTGQTVTYNATSSFAGSNIKLNGNTRLAPDYPTDATATCANLPAERVLAVAKRTDIPARGMLSGTAHFNGTRNNPNGSVDLSLARGVVYDEPVDNLTIRAAWMPRAIDIQQLAITEGPSRLDLTAHYDHPPGDFYRGTRHDSTSTAVASI